ncbi:hypothetical protein GCM10018790_69410 [Kitasatospora xanthocidica]|uniref:hypothetical protein n=1 Tax=Kitasatospora xanthocidica TaxID=83382 RepID=UPI0016734F37|nr:hypothetical protein [Kitasatospora xanthocidica]GHF81867.1 hypothetical protein GCM10018790_69410 [Kitasatospora xanthocidica]
MVHGGVAGTGRLRVCGRSVGVLLAAAALFAAAPAVTPAQAEGADGLVLTVPSTLAVISPRDALAAGPPLFLPFEVARSGGGALRQVTITVDDAATGVRVTAPGTGQGGQYTAPHTWTLPLGDGDGPVARALQLDIPRGGFDYNYKTLHVTASAAGLAPVTRDVVLRPADRSPLMQLAPMAPVSAGPGDVLTPRPGIQNSGAAPAQKVVLSFTTVDGLDPAETFSNCEYAEFPEDDPPTGGRPDAQHAICTFDRTVQPGEAYVLDPFALNVTGALDSTWATFAVGGEEGAEAVNWRALHPFRQGTGRPLELVRIAGLQKEGLRSVQTYRVAAGEADVTVEAAWKPTSPDGLAGDLTVTLRNTGRVPFVNDPADLLRRDHMDVTPPWGTKEAERPDNCVIRLSGEIPTPEGASNCTIPRFIDVGGKFGFTLPLVLTEESLGRPARIAGLPDFVLSTEPAEAGPAPLYPGTRPAPPVEAPPLTAFPPGADAPPASDAAPAAAPPPAPQAAAAPAAHHVRLRWKAAGFLAVLGAVGVLLLAARRHRRKRETGADPGA